MKTEERLRAFMREVDAMPEPDLWPQVRGRIRPRSRPRTRLAWAIPPAVAGSLVVIALVTILGRAAPSGPGTSAGIPTPTVGETPAGTVASGAPSAAASPSPGAMASSPPPQVPSGSLVVATLPPGAGAGDALASGLLGGRELGGTGCFWVDIQGGSREALVWPHGFAASADPLAILGPDGQLLATTGDTVDLGGGAPAAGASITRAEDPCSLGRLFLVSVVASVNGTPVSVGEGSLRLTTRPAGAVAACPSGYLPTLTLVMAGGSLRLRPANGADLNASWPDLFGAKPGARIMVVDPSGRVVATQGVGAANLRGQISATGVAVCGVGTRTYP